MPVSQTASADLLLPAEEFHPLQAASPPIQPSEYVKGAMLPRTNSWAPQKRHRRYLSVVWTLLAAASVVFLIYRCRGRTVSIMGSNSAQGRRLGDADEGSDQEAEEWSLSQVCGGMGGQGDPTEGALSADPLNPYPAPVVFSEGLTEDEPPRKRMRSYKPEQGRGSSAVGATLFEGEHESESKWKSFDLPQSSSSIQKRFQEWQPPADYGENSSEGAARELPGELVQFTFEEARRASEGLSALSMDLPEPALLSEELSPAFLDDQLESYISEALQKEEGSLLEQWILDPHAPMPPSPVQMPSGEVEEESLKGSVGGESILRALLKSAQSHPRGRKPSQDSSSSGSDERRGKSPHELEKFVATSESTTQQKARASTSSPSGSASSLGSYAAEGGSLSLEAGASSDEREGEAGGSNTGNEPSGAQQVPPGLPQLSEVEYVNHPFYRLPVVPVWVLQQLGKTRIKPRGIKVDFWGAINLSRDLLSLPTLNLEDAELLQNCADMLRSHAMSHLMKPLNLTTSTHFSFAAMMRFLVADTLWSSWEVLRGSRGREAWFGLLTDKMLSTLRPWSASNIKARRITWRQELVSRIFAVADTYKADRRPSAKDVVQIKQMIFCGEIVQPPFNQTLWDRWREADKQYREGLGQDK
ncbi:hypothetical protein Emed_004276 [Eimeria media]